MYVKTTIERFVRSIVPNVKDIYHFDNNNGTYGFRVVINDKVTRKQIDEIERRTELFLVSINPITEYYSENAGIEVELEFLQI